MIELGKKIKMVREYNDLSQEELGAVVQKTKSTIGRYEKGLMEIPAKVIIDLCNYYQLSLDAFVESDYYASHQHNLEKNVSLRKGALAALDPQQLVNYFNLLPDSSKSHHFRLHGDRGSHPILPGYDAALLRILQKTAYVWVYRGLLL